MVVSRYVKVQPSRLTPFVSSDSLGAILAEVFLHPEDEMSISSIARTTGVAQAVAHKEITRLIDARVLLDRRDGNNRLVRVNPGHPLYGPMSEIVAATYGPVPVLRDLLGGVAGVDEAFIYGSWAARRAGQPGAWPRDIDVMVVGQLSIDDLLDVQQASRARLSREVNVQRVSPEAWARHEDDPFLAEVASRPIVWLVTKGGADG